MPTINGGVGDGVGGGAALRPEEGRSGRSFARMFSMTSMGSPFRSKQQPGSMLGPGRPLQ